MKHKIRAFVCLSITVYALYRGWKASKSRASNDVVQKSDNVAFESVPLPSMSYLAILDEKCLDQHQHVIGVTQVDGYIYTSCSFSNIIHVYADKEPFPLVGEIVIDHAYSLADIAVAPCSDEQQSDEHYLYATDPDEQTVWRIRINPTRGWSNKNYEIDAWVTDFRSPTISVSDDGHVILINQVLLLIVIYAPNGKQILQIQTDPAMQYPIHAQLTSLYADEDGKFKADIVFVNAILDGGQTSHRIRRISSHDGLNSVVDIYPSTEYGTLNDPSYVFPGPDKTLLVAETGNHRILWFNEKLRPVNAVHDNNEPTELLKIKNYEDLWPIKLSYCRRSKLLIIGAGSVVHVYSLQ